MWVGASTSLNGLRDFEWDPQMVHGLSAWDQETEDPGMPVPSDALVIHAVGTDRDGDQWPDYADNCAYKSNPTQSDVDGDGYGDACDDDSDGDGLMNAVDNCPLVAGVDQTDFDRDGIGDACDANQGPDPSTWQQRVVAASSLDNTNARVTAIAVNSMRNETYLLRNADVVVYDNASNSVSRIVPLGFTPKAIAIHEKLNRIFISSSSDTCCAPTTTISS